MRDKTKLKIKIISSFLMCFLSLFSLVSLTLSWFAFNDDVGGNGMNIITSHDDDLVGYEYYSLIKDSVAQKYNLTLINGNPSLGLYDATSDDYSIVVKIYLNQSVESKTVKVFAETNADYFLGDSGYPLLPPQAKNLGMPDTSKLEETENYTNSLTSIVRFTVLNAEEIIELTGDGLASLPQDERFSTFIDLTETDTDGTHTPKSSISLKQDENAEIETYSESEQYNGQTCTSIYLLISYDSLLVNTVFSANIGNDDMYLKDSNGEILTGENGLPYPIPFVCDFSIALDIM